MKASQSSSSPLAIGSKAPHFRLMGDNDAYVSLSDFKGQKLILYFYPKDDTPGCTQQACDFRDHFKAFNKISIPILGVSKDSPESHAQFRKKYKLNFPLLCDEDGAICSQYNVWVEKSMYGKKYMGIERTTFLINEKGMVEHIWKKVSVKGHVEDVLQTLTQKLGAKPRSGIKKKTA